MKKNKMQASVKVNSYYFDFREKGDRRSFGLPTQFPFLDSSDNLLLNDRRSMPDRRIANIQVKEEQLHSVKKLLVKKKEI